MKPEWYESRSLQGAAVFAILLVVWYLLLRDGITVPVEIPGLVSAAFAAFIATRAVQRARK